MEVSVTNGGTMEYLPSGIAFVHFLTITNDVDPKQFVCPDDANRRPATNFGAVFNNYNLSYFLGVSAGTNPAATIFLATEISCLIMSTCDGA